MIKDHMRRWFLLSIMVSIFIQIVGISILNPIDGNDSKEYLSISGSLFNGKGYGVTGTSFKGFESFVGEIPTRMRQPGYPLFLVIFYWTLGERVVVTQMSQVALNVLTIYLLFLISRMTLGNKLWGGTFIMLGLYFPLWLTSALVLSETLFTFMLMLFMYLLMKAMYTQSLGKFALAGVFGAFAVLTKALAFPVVFLSIVPIYGHVKNLRKLRLFYGVLFGAFLLVLFPWMLRNLLVLGDFTFLSTDGGYNIWVSSIGEEKPKWCSDEFRFAVQDGYYFDREANNRFISLAINHIKADPLGHFVRGIKRVAWVWSYFPGSQAFKGNSLLFGLFTATQILILLCAVIGIFSIDYKTNIYYLLPSIGISCMLITTTSISRYIVPTMPFVLTLAGQGFARLKQSFWS